MAGGINLYSYAGNNPVSFSDPYGLSPECPPCDAVAEAVKGASAAAGSPKALDGSAIAALPFIKDEVPDTRTYLTYTRTHPTTHEVYVGRTSGYGSPQELATQRAKSHPAHLSDFSPPVVDRVATGKGAYSAIRGREQQLIDASGGIGSPFVANKIRAVSAINPAGPEYHREANRRFGEIAPYSGKLGFLYNLLP